jgi:hypothetical protein
MDSKPTPLPYALTAFAVAALLEYPLGKRFPLQKPVPMFNRMAVAGALAFVGTYASFYIVSGLQRRPQLP